VRFQARHSNELWQFDMSPSDLKQVKQPLWIEPGRGSPTLMLYSVVDDRSGVAPNPYHVLVSEAMLQQTQVATVVPYFTRFIERFPTLADLAAAEEQDVLRLWQGLGYYSRARNLRAAARAVATNYGGELPRERDELLKLPGVGRYTAGAVASIAFDRRAPILDGNVARVLCRIDKIETDPRERLTQELLWRRAEKILPRRRVGAFNTAMMELGATVCIPRSPQCLICPVREHCEAFAAGVQETIPPARKAKETPLLRRVTFCVRRGEQWLIEQRPATGQQQLPARGGGERREDEHSSFPRALGHGGSAAEDQGGEVHDGHGIEQGDSEQ